MNDNISCLHRGINEEMEGGRGEKGGKNRKKINEGRARGGIKEPKKN